MSFEEQRKALIEIVSHSVSDPRVLEAIGKVPREEFLPSAIREYSYADDAMPTLCGQTISQPTIVGIMTELLRVKEGHRILEVGAGSGYQAAILAELAGRKGHVYTIDRIPELVKFSEENLKLTGYGSRVTVVYGDGSLGLPEYAPYDRIMVTAACPKVPKPLIDQLKDGGKLVLPLGSYLYQELILVEKEKGKLKQTKSIPCMFVPLIGKEGWSGP